MELAPLNPIALAMRKAGDNSFVARWKEIYITRNVHAEIEAAKYPGIRAIYLGRALFHAYHAEIDAYIQGRKEPLGGFPTDHGGVPVYHDPTMDESGIRTE